MKKMITFLTGFTLGIVVTALKQAEKFETTMQEVADANKYWAKSLTDHAHDEFKKEIKKGRVTVAELQEKLKPAKNRKEGRFRHVYRINGNRWYAQLDRNGKTETIATCDREIDAARAVYDYLYN